MQRELLDIVTETTSIDRDLLTPETRIADLGLDSLDIILILFEVEEKYDLAIPWSPGDPETKLETVGDVLTALEKVVAEKEERS